MALMDEFKEERENMKKAPLKEKIDYIWQYYKWHILIPLIIIIGLSSYIYTLVTKPDILLDGILLNTYNTEASDMTDKLTEEFFKVQNIDGKKYDISLNSTLSYNADTLAGATDYETSQILTAWLAAGDIDFISGDLSTMTTLAYKDYFADLRDILSEEQIKTFEPYFLYIDEAVLFAPTSDEVYDLTAVDTEEYPDCTKPVEMDRPIPVLIDISGYKKLEELYANPDELVLGIAVNSDMNDIFFEFLDFLKE